MPIPNLNRQEDGTPSILRKTTVYQDLYFYRKSVDESKKNNQFNIIKTINTMKHFTHFKSSILRGLLSLFFLVAMVSSAWGKDVTGTITFGTNDVKINAASVTGDDDLGNSWTITTVGTTSFTSQPTYNQVGSSSKPATSITFTTTLPAAQTIKSMSAKFGGFSGTEGTVTLKVGDTTVGTGSLNATTDVTVTSTKSGTGTALTVTVTGIAKGVKCYNISYTYDNGSGSTTPTPTALSVPSNLSSSNVTSTEATLSWNTVANASSYTLKIGDNEIQNATSPYTATGLTASTQYTWTVKAVGDGENYYDSEYATNKTFTTLAPISAASLPFEFNGGKSDIGITTGITQTGLGSDYLVSPKLKFDDTNDNIIVKYNEAAKSVTYTLKGNGTSGDYSFDIMESTDGVNYTSIHTHASLTKQQTFTDNLNTESRYVKFIFSKKGNGNFALGNIKIVQASYKEPVTLAFYNVSFSANAANKQVTATPSNALDDGTITYSLVEGDANAFSINAETGAITCTTSGEYTVKAEIAETSDFAYATANCKVTINEAIYANSVIIAEREGSYYAMTTESLKNEYFTSAKLIKDGDKYIYTGDINNILFNITALESGISIQNPANGQYVQATDAKKISYSNSEFVWKKIGNSLNAGSSYGTLRYNDPGSGAPRFTTYTSETGQDAMIIDASDVIGGTELRLPANNTAGNWATFSNSGAVVFDSNTNVYTVNVSGTAMTLDEVTNKQVPANNGVLINSEKESVWYATITSAPVLENNMLKAASVAMNDNATRYYRLAYDNYEAEEGLGFYYGAAGGIAFTCKAGTAYLAVPTSAGASEIRGFSFDDLENGNETAIPEIDPTGEVPLIIYTMTGIRIPKVVEDGLYIVNGKTKWMLAE